MSLGVVAVVVVGALIVIVLLALVGRANPRANEGAPPLLHRPSSQAPEARPTALVAWEANILAASTGGARGRGRLGRHIEPIVESILRDRHGLTMDDPEAQALLGAEWAFLQGRRPAPGTAAEVEPALTALLDRLVTAPARRGA